MVVAVDVAHAQTVPTPEPRVHAYLELGGTSFLLGVRVARDFERYGGSIGVAPLPDIFSGGLGGFVLSGMAHGFAADGRFEVGAGPMGLVNLDGGLEMVGVGYAGFRFVPSGSGTTFRIGVAAFGSVGGASLWPSFSLGRVR